MESGDTLPLASSSLTAYERVAHYGRLVEELATEVVAAQSRLDAAKAHLREALAAVGAAAGVKGASTRAVSARKSVRRGTTVPGSKNNKVMQAMAQGEGMTIHKIAIAAFKAPLGVDASKAERAEVRTILGGLSARGMVVNLGRGVWKVAAESTTSETPEVVAPEATTSNALFATTEVVEPIKIVIENSEGVVEHPEGTEPAVEEVVTKRSRKQPGEARV